MLWDLPILYLTPQFYKSKAIELFFDEPISADDLDDHTLGKALDEISNYGATRLFGELAFGIAQQIGLLGELAHLDTTSFSLQGKYETEETEVIEVKHGFSKDHRRDLKQVVLSLIMTGPANLPIWMEPQDGNSSDKASFHETIRRVQSFTENMSQNHDFCWVADSALYTPDKLLKHNSIKWISCVPESIKEAKNLVDEPDDSFKWYELENGYKWTEVESNYGGIQQRWILISSEQAYNREKQTIEKQFNLKLEELERDCWHLSNKLFNCPEDAIKAVIALQKKHKYYTISYEVTATEKYRTKGRPGKDSSKEVKGYQLTCKVLPNKGSQDKALIAKGRFILATNNLDLKALPSDHILKQYKQQQKVENGFRFLKDPWFMLDSFYVKKRSRIEALMMVMTLSLMAYNYAQYRLREMLLDSNETLPNQRGKPIQNPTLKWIFQLLEGIAVVHLYDPNSQCYRKLVTNLDDLRRKIIYFMGPTACKIYGLI